MSRRVGRGITGLALAFWALLPAAQAGMVTLSFEDIPLSPTGLEVLGVPYSAEGYSLVSTSGYSVRGPGTDSANYTPETFAGSGAVSTSLAPFAPGTVTLFRDDGQAFDLLSIDLAREFRFNTPDVGQAYPEVTFTGVTSLGSIVTQTFTADLADFAFQTFTFSSAFRGLLVVSWEQPPFTSGTPASPAPGLHQFDNLVLNVVPEPPGLALQAIGMGAVGLTLLRRLRRS